MIAIHLFHVLLLFCCMLYSLRSAVLYGVALAFCFSTAHTQQRFNAARGLDPTKPISEYRHSVWTVDNGLPQNSAQALCQTRDGYLWIGTQEGLVRFDGLNFKVFDKSNAPAISSKFILALLETSTGVIWGGGSNGSLFSMQHDIFTKHTIDQAAQVLTIAEFRGQVWIGTSTGLYCWEQGKTSLQRFTINEGLPNNAIFSLASDTTRKILWIGTQKGLCAMDLSNTTPVFTKLFRGDGLVDETIRSLLLDSRGNVWIGSQGGLQQAIWQKNTLQIIKTFTDKNGLSDNVINALYEDTEHTLWIGTATQGLMRRTASQQAFETYRVQDGLSSNAVNTFIQDREGMLWVGNLTGGMNCFANASFTSYSRGNGLNAEYAWSVLQAQDSAMYINSSDAGVARFHNGKFTFGSSSIKRGA